jgi:selenophosphate synthase
MRRAWVVVAAAVVLAGGATASELVGVPGSGTQYASTFETSVGGKPVKLALTGTAMRTKLIVNVYALGSYVQQGAAVKSAEQLADADVAKRLHLIMERSVDGKDLAEAFRSALRASHPEPEFNEEVTSLVQYMRATTAKKGENIYLTHVPGIGLQINVGGKADFLIRNVAFSKAVWGIYLGKKNIGEAIKKGLTSRL